MKILRTNGTVIAIRAEEHVPPGAPVKMGAREGVAQADEGEWAFGHRLKPGEAATFPAQEEGIILVKLIDAAILALGDVGGEEESHGCPKCGGRAIYVGDMQEPELHLCGGTEDEPPCGHQWNQEVVE